MRSRETAIEDPALKDLLLDAPQLMGVESIELDTVNLRMVARTLPGKQFEVGRRIRVLVVAGAARAQASCRPTTRRRRWWPRFPTRPSAGAPRKRRRAATGAKAVTSWFKARLGRMRVSTRGARSSRSSRCSGCSRPSSRSRPPKRPMPAVVPPGFVPDPNYTWVPRTNVRRPKEADTTTTTTTPTTTTTETTTPSPDETDQPDVAHRARPTTTVIDPDGPGGPLGPQTLTQTPAPTTPTTAPPVPGTVPATPAAPR